MREFEERLLRLKQALGLSADQDVANALGMTKAALSVRKKRNAFPDDKVRALAGEHPEWRLDVDYILTGTSDGHKEINRRLSVLKASTDKMQKLGLPSDLARALQSILFFVEMEDAANVQKALRELQGLAIAPSPDEQALLDDYQRIAPSRRGKIRKTAAHAAGDPFPPKPRSKR